MTENKRKDFSFGWQRAQLLSAFFNGVFLFALAISIFLQSIERFVSLQSTCYINSFALGCPLMRGRGGKPETYVDYGLCWLWPEYYQWNILTW